MTENGKLTREEMEQIVGGLSTRDIFGVAKGDGVERNPGEIAAEIFDYSAKRQGFGEMALDRVHPSDATFLSDLLAESLNVGSPKADSGEGSQTSPDIGG